MANEKWASPSIPRKLYEELEDIAKSPYGEKLGFFSGKDIIVMLIRDYLQDHKKRVITFLGIQDENILLYDGIMDKIVVLRIDEHGILKCSVDKDPNCKHRSFCLQHDEISGCLEKSIKNH